MKKYFITRIGLAIGVCTTTLVGAWLTGYYRGRKAGKEYMEQVTMYIYGYTKGNEEEFNRIVEELNKYMGTLNSKGWKEVMDSGSPLYLVNTTLKRLDLETIKE